jgi:hypothetical protein
MRTRPASPDPSQIQNVLPPYTRRVPAPVMHNGFGVRGAITSKDVLVHSVAIVRLFGPAVYVRCLRAIWSGRPCTFLEVLAERR